MSRAADEPRVVAADDLAGQPWKNGGGITRELLRLPMPGGDGSDWLLRISLADIDADGPFSPFPGVVRLFAVIDGAGVRLGWPDGRPDRVMTPGEPPFRFDGADAPSCALLDGRTRDLNVMFNRDRARAWLAPTGFDEENRPGPEASAYGLFTLQAARLHGAAPEALDLPAHALVWCDAGKSASPTWRIERPTTAPAAAGVADTSRPRGQVAPAAYAIAFVPRPAPEAAP